MLPPTYLVDPGWPSRCPTTGWSAAVVGVAVDRHDHICDHTSSLDAAAQRDALDLEGGAAGAGIDQDGTLLSSWGGPGSGYEWPQLEHGIHVDDQDNVWLGAGGDKDAHLLKFHAQGKFPDADRPSRPRPGQQRHAEPRRPRRTWWSTAPPYELYSPRLRQPSHHRLRRHDRRRTSALGAYGKTPDDGYFTRAGEVLPGPFSGKVQNENKPSQYDPTGPPPPQFRIVHAGADLERRPRLRLRTGQRSVAVLQEDGTFVQEAFIARETFGSGRCGTSAFPTDPEQTFAILDGTNQQGYVLRRKTLEC